MKPSSTSCRQKTMVNPCSAKRQVKGFMHLTSYNDKIDGNKLKKIKTLSQ
jgi:hypothetical protein